MTTFSRFSGLFLLMLVVSSWLLGMNSLPLFDWDELNFAEIAREMMISGNWLQPTINYEPFYEKPPFFAWLQLLSYKVFGVNALAARFPNVIAGFITACCLYGCSFKKHGHNLALRFTVFFLLSLLPQLYFRSGIIDPWFNLFTLLALLPALDGRYYGWRGMLSSGLFLGLAVLTKGPAAGLIAGLCWLTLLVLKSKSTSGIFQRGGWFFLTGLIALVPISIWVALLWREDGGTFSTEFLRYQWRLFSKPDAGHGGFPGYHFLVLLLGCFPASVFALPALLRRKQYKEPIDGGMRILFWVVLLLFSVVSTKIVHYSSLCYFPLAWFAAKGVSAPRLFEKDLKRVRSGALIIWSLYGLVALSLPLAAWNLEFVLSYISDPELTSRLQLGVDWPAYTLLPSFVVLAGIGLQVFYRKATIWRQAGLQLLIMGLFVPVTLFCFAPRLQAYSQGAAVEFYQGLAGQNVSVGTAYYKSYAHWFYTASIPDAKRNNCLDRQCRFHGPNPLPLYFSSPLRKTEQVLREVPDANLLYQRGGFSFYLRPPAGQ